MVKGGEHARVRSLTAMQKRALGFRASREIVQRKTLKEIKREPTYSPAMTLAHILYPNNFVNQIGTQIRITKSGKKLVVKPIATLSERVDPDMMAVYNTREVNTLARKIESESGIVVNRYGMNVGWVRDGKAKQLVFFELGKIDMRKLRKRVVAMHSGLKKRQVFGLIKELEKYEENGFVYPHEGWL